MQRINGKKMRPFLQKHPKFMKSLKPQRGIKEQGVLGCRIRCGIDAIAFADATRKCRLDSGAERGWAMEMKT